MVSSSAILFFNNDVKLRLQHKKTICLLVQNIVSDAGCELSSINYIFCSDDFLYNMNLEFLNHDTLTDIITFDFSKGKEIKGEAYISLDRVKENAKKYKQILFKELLRVIFHGTLHLVGYNDKKKKEITIMRAKEDFYLREFFDLL